jgi:hypothetical protein
MAYDKNKIENFSNFAGINVKSSQYQTEINEALDLSNFDFQTIGALSKRQGSTQYIGATVAGQIGGIFEFDRLNGSSQIVFSANTNIYYTTGGAPISFRSGLLNNALCDMLTFVDRLFVANGQDFFKYDQSNSSNYSLPPHSSGITFSQGASIANGISGLITFYFGYKNDRGYYGPATSGVTISATSVSNITFSGFTTPSGYGISSIVLYATGNALTQGYRVTEFAPAATYLFQGPLTLTANPTPPYLWFTNTPKFIEIYNNQMFLAGFSSMLSTVYFSDIGEPEGVGATAFFEVRTNDGDKLTNMVPYLSQLVLFKEESFHSLSGDNPQNFLLRELSNQYGALNNRCAIAFEDTLIFLDKTGLMKFNGANISQLSDKVEPIFNSMNLTAAKQTACMVHWPERNEVWTSIPVNGATLNNCTVVYDYHVGAFTKFEGFSPNAMTLARATFSTNRIFFGDFNGRLHNFDESLLGDNGQGMTCLLKTRSFGEMGFSVEKLWRRLYLDTTVVSASFSPINLEFFVSNGTSLALTRTMGQTVFQSRIDFGLSSKSMLFQLTHNSNFANLRLNGFTIEYRFQRAV